MPTVAISNADIQSAAVNNKSSISASTTDKLTSSSSSTTLTTLAPREVLATINAKLVSAESVRTSTIASVANATKSNADVASERMTLNQSSTVIKTAASSNLKGSTSENNNKNSSNHSEGFLTPNSHHHNNSNSRQRISAVKVTLPPGGVKGVAAKNSKINAPPGLNYVFDAHPNINKHHHHDYR